MPRPEMEAKARGLIEQARRDRAEDWANAIPGEVERILQAVATDLANAPDTVQGLGVLWREGKWRCESSRDVDRKVRLMLFWGEHQIMNRRLEPEMEPTESAEYLHQMILKMDGT